jgi:hypothetical protein
MARPRVRVTLRLAVYRQSVRLSDKPLVTHDQEFDFPSENLRLWPLYNILSDGRTGLWFTIAAGSRLEGQAPVFTSPRNRVARLYPQALGSLFVASYDSQGYGGGIRPRHHTG